jgi:hypothetical protein
VPEPARQRHAFEIYWRLGDDRSIERLHEALKEKNGRAPSLRTLYGWSASGQWQHRIARLENEARIAEDEARITAIREMAERQARAGLLLQQKGTQWLIQFGDQDATVESAIRAIVEGAKLERLASGEPTNRQEVNNNVDARLTVLSDIQLEDLIDQATRLVDGTGEAPAG